MSAESSAESPDILQSCFVYLCVKCNHTKVKCFNIHAWKSSKMKGTFPNKTTKNLTAILSLVCKQTEEPFQQEFYHPWSSWMLQLQPVEVGAGAL